MENGLGFKVGLVSQRLEDTQLEQIISLGVAHFVDAYRIDEDESAQRLARARERWELELTRRLERTQCQFKTSMNFPPTSLILSQDLQTGRVAGFLYADRPIEQPGSCEVIFVVVHPAFRRQGLLVRMLDELARHYSTIKLDCKDERFFTGAGFVVTGQLGTHKTMERSGCRGKTACAEQLQDNAT
ncbi:Acetyltransferase (GNAT) family protein [Pseudomonas asturiensis]|uniref:Acetyltransferase (GNAT) family protein n=1 Tax=Pseudomonas asturiensis TaxID=1190415 RepID=A0A1M7N7E9_9PSED|nr:GNAT family N-acetyltransferase [Pseudomonas asturiensis]SHM98981.1 Acetyltransferase (GNAT) family protein [Pseudomonas asturiensis]